MCHTSHCQRIRACNHIDSIGPNLCACLFWFVCFIPFRMVSFFPCAPLLHMNWNKAKRMKLPTYNWGVNKQMLRRANADQYVRPFIWTSMSTKANTNVMHCDGAVRALRLEQWKNCWAQISSILLVFSVCHYFSHPGEAMASTDEYFRAGKTNFMISV